MSVGFATSEAHPDLTPEDQAVSQALAARGISVTPIVWSVTRPDHVTPRLIVIRSCWDYHHRPDEFLSWADAVQARGARVLNAPATPSIRATCSCSHSCRRFPKASFR